MPIEILMPALSPTMEEGTLTKWCVQEGAAVSSGDVLAEIETDKAVMEVEAVDEGVLGKILVPEGTQGVKVNTVIALLLAEGESAEGLEIRHSQKNGATQESLATPMKGEASVHPPLSVSPAAQSLSREPTPASSEGPGVAAASGRIFASPLARRLAMQAGLNLHGLTGTGPHGRIIQRDVEAALSKKEGPFVSPEGAEAATGGTFPPSPSLSSIMALFDPDSVTLVPHDTMRKTIAQRLTQSKQTVPHFYLSLQCSLDALLDLRRQLNEAAPQDEKGVPRYKLSVNDLVVKAYALALKEVPDANVSWTEEGMLHHKTVDVAVAVAIPGGLITPILRNAQDKALSVLSCEMKDLAQRARERKLKPHEYQGGTTSISNLGMYGVTQFSAVLNPPQATILSVGAGVRQPILVGDTVTVGTVMTVTLSTDHRAVDGALGAQVLARFKKFIEHPLLMLI